MKYKEISKNASKYIFILNFIIAFILNIMLIIITLIISKFVCIRYQITLNNIIISITIVIYILTFLLTSITVSNYKYVVDNKKVEVISGALIYSRKFMLTSNVFEINIQKGIIGRLFSIASINFVGSGGNVKVKYIDYNEINEIVSNVKTGDMRW